MTVQELDLEALKQMVRDRAIVACRIIAECEPTGGPDGVVYPPTFPTDRGERTPYLIEPRRRQGAIVNAALLDQVPSQSNHCEGALGRAWHGGLISMPMLRLTHEGMASAVITGLDAPHRIFDAYWRDSLLDGVKFDKTDVGRATQAATLDDASALLRHDPASLVYGCWNSHRRGKAAKFPRIYASEIVGWEPELGCRKAGRMDPLNLTGSRSGEGDEWSYSPAAKSGSKTKLSEIGHGNIAPSAAHGGVTIDGATRTATLSLNALRRIGFGDMTESAQQAARVYLAALALLGDRLAFGEGGIYLRSGCDLVVLSERLEWTGRGGQVTQFELSPEGAVELYTQALEAVQSAGVGMVLDTIELTPSKALAAAIDYSLTKSESAGD